MSIKDDWLPCSEVTLQGNITIAGFAAKTWHAKPSVCEIHLHANSGMARIDWHHSSVLVSASVIQHATIDVVLEHERDRATQRFAPTASELTTPVDKPLENPRVAEPQTRADEILAEFDHEEATHTRRRGKKPKAN